MHEFYFIKIGYAFIVILFTVSKIVSYDFHIKEREREVGCTWFSCTKSLISWTGFKKHYEKSYLVMIIKII